MEGSQGGRGSLEGRGACACRRGITRWAGSLEDEKGGGVCLWEGHHKVGGQLRG